MIKWISICLLAVFVCAGCASRGKKVSDTSSAAASRRDTSPTASESQSKPSRSQKLIVTPGELLTGKVATYNDAGRFVVMDFPLGHMPGMDQRLFVYRQGLKVGEVKVTGPQRENHIVADLVSGEAQTGDEVRDK